MNDETFEKLVADTRENPLITDLPPADLRFMNDREDEKFVQIGDTLLANALKHTGDVGTVLDIGCGYGRLAYALNRRRFSGQYSGVDILQRHIGWLTEHFKHPNYQFQLLNVRNDRYNPTGELEARDVRLEPGFRPDLVLVFSVFTHMYEDDIRAYLSEIRRVVHPLSIVYATFFIKTAAKRSYEFSHQLNDHCWYFNEDDPLHAIAYDEEWLIGLFHETGFSLREIVYGHQDSAVLVPTQ